MKASELIIKMNLTCQGKIWDQNQTSNGGCLLARGSSGTFNVTCPDVRDARRARRFVFS
ncbi:hypothetical protein [Paraburkholderia dinghuensis]|uniref:hypothetical protein n=1 Tax=Paraburkholderia dinghuensis TaxID=2305225 RepID=UPI001623C87B|nr:hypothetical protein [Paraburkholderia dinghuensis]